MGVMLRAVVVGINEYKDERYREKALRFATGDAKEIAGLLRSPQATKAFTVESLRLLTDAEASRKAVRECLKSTFTSRSFDSNTLEWQASLEVCSLRGNTRDSFTLASREACHSR